MVVVNIVWSYSIALSPFLPSGGREERLEQDFLKSQILYMTQQYQTKTQKITMFFMLLALVIVIAQKVAAGTCTAGQYEAMQCDKNTSTEIADISTVSDLPWSPFIAFLTR
ncbi:MAG: hypothetical protein QM768_19415 [Agriterribacter sp.]